MQTPHMNWKLLFSLSLLGLVMAVATLYWIGPRIEPLFWLIDFVFCAWMIVRRAPGRLFLHGFVLGLLNCVWVTAAHYIWYDTYMANHPQMADMMKNSPIDLRTMQLIVGPFIGAISGVVIGLITLLVGAIAGKKPAAA